MKKAQLRKRLHYAFDNSMEGPPPSSAGWPSSPARSSSSSRSWSGHKELNAVFADLEGPEGSEVDLKPAGTYVELGRPVTSRSSGWGRRTELKTRRLA